MKQYGDFLFTSQVLKVYNEVRMNPEDVEWRLEVARLLQLLFCKDDIILKLNVDNDTGCPFNLENFQIAVTFLLFGIFPICKKIWVIKIFVFNTFIFLKNLYKLKIHPYNHRGVQEHIFVVFKNDLSFLTSLQYYNKKYIIIHYYFIVIGGLLGFLVRLRYTNVPPRLKVVIVCLLC